MKSFNIRLIIQTTPQNQYQLFCPRRSITYGEHFRDILCMLIQTTSGSIERAAWPFQAIDLSFPAALHGGDILRVRSVRRIGDDCESPELDDSVRIGLDAVSSERAKEPAYLCR